MTRCSTVRSLLDRYVDGSLAPGVAQAVSAHVASCDACTRLVAFAQRLPEMLASTAPITAPEGFRRKVMEEVYRLSMVGYPHLAAEVDRETQRGRSYRRLGMCFMLSAALLAVTLVFPRASYQTIFASKAVAADLSSNGARVVRMTLIGADRVVRETLMKPEEPTGGQNRGDLR